MEVDVRVFLVIVGALLTGCLTTDAVVEPASAEPTRTTTWAAPYSFISAGAESRSATLVSTRLLGDRPADLAGIVVEAYVSPPAAVDQLRATMTLLTFRDVIGDIPWESGALAVGIVEPDRYPDGPLFLRISSDWEDPSAQAYGTVHIATTVFTGTFDPSFRAGPPEGVAP